MGRRLLEFFDKVERENVAMGDTRMMVKLGISKKQAGEVEDTPELIAKAETILQELIKTKDLFKVGR